MNIDTNTAGGQQPNPGADDGANPAAANPNGQSGTVPAGTEGQGDGVTKTGSDAGEQGNTGKKEGEPGAGDGQDKGEQAPLTGAPEAYADFTMPEGFVLEGDRKEAALALFRDLDLSQDGAQRAIDHFIKTVGEDDAMRAAAMEAGVAQQREAWGEQAKKELGDKYDATVALARTAVLSINSPALLEAFDSLGWGNHPELIKLCAHFGSMMRDSPMDGIGNPGAVPGKEKPWDALYKDKM